MAQLLRCLLLKHENLSGIPNTHGEKLGVVSHTPAILMLGRQRRGNPWSLCLPSLVKLVSSRFSEGAHLN